MHDCHEHHDDPLKANLLFIVSADQVRGADLARLHCQLASSNLPRRCSCMTVLTFVPMIGTNVSKKQ